MSKVVCIPDTSAYWHLKGITVGGKDIRSWLASEFEMWLPKAILNEVRRKRRDLDVTDKTLNKLTQHPTIKVDMSRGARSALANLIDSAITNFDDEELSCVVLGLRLLIARRSEVRHVIILSDDFRAFETEQARRLLSAVPSFCFWNSADFVLYLAVRLRRVNRPDMSLKVFLDALETALYNSSPMASASNVPQSVKEKWRRRLEDYRLLLQRAFQASGFSW